MLLDALTTDRFGAVAPKYAHAFHTSSETVAPKISMAQPTAATIKPIHVSLLNSML
jgi:hypothetical protein